jgi:nucleotide sugar dehydrogenase
MNQSLKARLDEQTATIGIIGLGYVGLPLSLAFTDAGFEVCGFDIDDNRVSQLQAGDSYVDDVSDAELMAGLDSTFTPASEATNVAGCDAYIIAVPTGIIDGEPSMGAVRAAAQTIVEQAPNRETLVVVSSTVYPGATNEVVAPIVSADRPDGTTQFAMVPERLNPGGDRAIADIPLVIGADNTRAREAAATLFGSITETVPVERIETAELSKTLENTYRMVNIALVNQLVTLAERLDGDVWEAINAAGTKPFGFQMFDPGPGVGGHCIPIDPQFLTWRASELGSELPFIQHAQEVNETMPDRVIDDVATSIMARGTHLSEATVIILGAAYKPNIGDSRNSPAITIFEGLRHRTDATLVDPHVDSGELEIPIVNSVTDNAIKTADAVVLLVDHDMFDLRRFGEHAEFIYDAKNAVPTDVSATVVTLGEGTRHTDTHLRANSS